MKTNWKKVKLGSLTKIQTGKLDANASSKDGIYPFFTCAQEISRINEFAYDTECILVAGNGDLNVKYYKGKFNAYQRTYIIESTDEQKLFVRYAYYFLSSYIDRLREGSIGGVIKYIRLGDLTDAEIPLPPLDIQKKIADALDKADEIRRKRKEAIDKLDELVQSVFLDMFGDPVKNEKKWDIKKFGEIGTLERGKSKHRPRNDEILLGGKYPLIQTGDVANSGGYITEYTQTYSEVGLQQSKLWESGTLCITIAANIAKTGILTFDACFPDSVVGFKPDEKQTNTEFIQVWLSFLQKILEESAPESAQKNINLSILRDLDVIVPPIEKQDQFRAIYNMIFKEQDIMNNSDKAKENLFNSLMQKAFKGELEFKP